jgi:hypothetical protein
MDERRAGDLILGDVAEPTPEGGPEGYEEKTSIRTWDDVDCPHCSHQFALAVFAKDNAKQWSLYCTKTPDELQQMIENLPGFKRDI